MMRAGKDEQMAMVKLEPAKKSAIWGGRKLIEEFGKGFDGENLAETWELSAHPDGLSVIASGEDVGLTLPEYIEKYGKGILGANCEKFEDFPILIKLIDAKSKLSVQVHPDDAYARKYENQYGKTEMWYVVEDEPGAKLCYGCKREVSKDEFRKHIADNTLDEVMNMVPVKQGDVFFIEAGTIHAIGGGIVVVEIQQNSNVTYRVYDYGRVGADGKPRELHIEKALDVAKLAPPRTDYDFGGHIGVCDCFVVDLFRIDGAGLNGNATVDSFVSLLVVEGEGAVENNGETLSMKKGDSILITAGSGAFFVKGKLTVIQTVVP